jgi:gas vesicle protein
MKPQFKPILKEEFVMSKKGSFLEIFFLGAVVGVIAGILFAPSSGEETRSKLKKIKEENDDLVKDTKEKTETLIAKTMDAIEQGFDKLTEMVDEKKDGDTKASPEKKA